MDHLEVCVWGFGALCDAILGRGVDTILCRTAQSEPQIAQIKEWIMGTPPRAG